MKTFFAIEALLSVATLAMPYDPINVTVNGVEQQLYLQVLDWADATVTNQAEVGMVWNSRAYLSYSDTKGDVEEYFKPKLLGGYVEYDVDLSGQECNCIAALYMVSMPGKEADGTYHASDDFAYCDAAGVGGLYCPEFDLMEANKQGFSAVAHKCDPPNAFGHYSTCGPYGGCSVSAARQFASSYGPGSSNLINTDFPFHVKHTFQSSPIDLQFASHTVTMTQNGNNLVMDSDTCAYLSNMTGDLNEGMVFAISTWPFPGNPTWLQEDRCNSAPACPTTSNFSISNLVFREGPVYKYGNPCSSTHYGCDLCTDTTCHWSFPYGDPLGWSSPDSGCRCLPPQKDPSYYTFGDGTAPDLNSGTCFGCDSCKWSWATNDIDMWLGYSAMYRCEIAEPEPTVVYKYGDPCLTTDAGCDSCTDTTCHWSYPFDDPLGWSSTQTSCRCLPPQEDPGYYIYSDTLELDSTRGACFGCDTCKYSYDPNDALLFVGPSALWRCDIPSHPPTVVYKYGDPCSSTHAGCDICTDTTCHWSYPFDDPLGWSSTQTSCRCLPPQEDPGYYIYSDTLELDSTRGACFGCDTCKYSYDPNDALLFVGPSALWRCDIPSHPEFTWGDACQNLYDDECGIGCTQCTFSWPFADDLTSPDAKCRCQNTVEYKFTKKVCRFADQDLCGSYCKPEGCRISFPKDDPLRRKSPEKACRCNNWY